MNKDINFLQLSYGNFVSLDDYMFLEQENKILKENNLAMQEEIARTWKKIDEKENIINKAKEELYIWGEILNLKFQKRMLKILEKSDK